MRYRLGLLVAGGLTGSAAAAAATSTVLNPPQFDFADKIDFNFDPSSLGIVRFGRATWAAAAIVVDYKMSVYYKPLPEDPKLAQQLWSEVHLRSANRLLDLCKANGGVFIKVGQHLGALDYLLPPEYIKTLSILHSQAPLSSLKDVFKVIKEDLKQDRQEIFSEFDPKPLGAASLAQVYKAKLKSGETVAVKVQHRAVKPHSAVDIRTMETLVRIAAKAFPDFKLLWLVDETKKNLPVELDFVNEGRNADRLRSYMQDFDWLKIPKIYYDYSTERVLVMEYYEGGQINDLKYMKRNKISPREVTSKLGEMYSQMIFIHGYVHCDPHPGNVLVRKNTKGKLELALLDHGLYTTLPEDFRYNYSNLWLNILASDVNGIKKYSEALGVGNLYGLFACMVTARSWESISSPGGITKKKVTKDEQTKIKDNIGHYLPEISDILDKVPRPMIMIFKTNDLLRGVEHALGTQKTMTSFTTMSKFCVKAVYTQNIRVCTTTMCRIRNELGMHLSLFRIRVYEMYLWFSSLFLRRNAI